MIAILELLLLWYVFWPLAAIFSITSYCTVANNEYGEWKVFPIFLLAAVVIGLGFYYPSFGAYLFTLKGAITATVSYVIVGGIVSMWKWLVVLMNFKEKAKTYDLKSPGNVDYHCIELIKHVFPSFRQYDITHKNAVLYDGHKYYLNSKVFPISYWWTYWPLFLFSVVFDPIARIIRRLTKWLSDVYETVSKMFSVG